MIKLIENNKIKFEWRYNCQNKEFNVYLEKLGDNDLEYLGKIVLTEDFYQKQYEVNTSGFYRIVVFPVKNSIEDKNSILKTNYIYVGTKNVLEYCFGEEPEFCCKYFYIKRLDHVVLKEKAYLYSVKDDIKIPFTTDLKQGQKYYISDFEDLKIELKYPHNLGIDIRLV